MLNTSTRARNSGLSFFARRAEALARGENAPKRARGRMRESRVGAYLAAHRWSLLGTVEQFRRMPYSTALTCVALAISLAFPAVLMALLQNAQRVAAQWEGGAQISLFLKADTSEAQAQKLAESLRDQRDIATVTYVSKQSALEEFKANSGLGDALSLLSDNPLPPVLVVHPKESRAGPDAIEKLAKSLQSNPLVDVAQWDMQWLQRLHALIAVAERAVWVIGALLLVAALVVIGNTIRLAVQNNAQQIKVTKLIGASDAFVRRPFLYAGLIYGMVGGALALVLVSAVLWALTEPVRSVAQAYNSNFALHGLGFGYSAVVIAAGVTLGLVGAFLSVGRHLRAIEPA
jgi:cell division transport system permease protein